MMISEQQRRTFSERGLIRIDRLLPDETVAPARDLALQDLEQQGVWRDGDWLADVPANWELARRLLRSLRRRTRDSSAYKDLVTAPLLEAVRGLVDGRAVHALTNRPQLLFTPPNATEWTVPHKIWHLDAPRLGEVGLPGVQMFAFLDAVAPGAGGTLVVAGSHRLLNHRGRIRSKDAKRLLKREPYFRDLLQLRQKERQHFLEEPGHVGDVALQVVELCGEPGDVVLMDLRVLHTLAPNASRAPRLMVTQRFVLDSVADQLWPAESRPD